jgi:hypothetical protein
MSIFSHKTRTILEWEKDSRGSVSHKTLDMVSNFDKIHVLPPFYITYDSDFSRYIPFIMHLDIYYI